MYSDQDTLAGGFPHSDIRGSTIARISPRLFAACHVLLRLLAPRHPPNALIALNTPPTPARRTKPHIQASAAEPKKCPATHTLQSNQQIRFTCQTARHPAQTPFKGPLAGQPSRYAASNDVQVTTRPQPNGNQLPWRRSGSNRRPPACKAGALPLSYAPENQFQARAAGQAPQQPSHKDQAAKGRQSPPRDTPRNQA
jgi:hypothetical protein